MGLHKKCLICKGGKKNDCLYWHLDEKTGLPWVWCSGKCQRGYSLEQYCDIAGVDINEFIKNGIDLVKEVPSNEVQAMAWPSTFIPLSDPRAEKGVEYIKSRGLNIDGDMYYDLNEEGIVFPYYVENHFCGAQVRFLEERINEDGDKWKITTLPGTRLGLLFYGWNQGKLLAQVKGVIVTEGAFNALSIQQALNSLYGGLSRCPWRVIACSGSGVSEHQAETLKELKDRGIKVVCASDTDEAGIEMYKKLNKFQAITHYAFTGDTDKDWNNLLAEMGHQEFAKFIIKSIKSIDEKM